MEIANELSSSPSFASSSYVSNGSSYHNVPTSPSPEPGKNLELLSLSKLSGSLEKLLEDVEYDYSDALIDVESIEVGVHRCLLAARSPFFHELFMKEGHSSVKEEKPKYLMSDLIPNSWVGYEAFKVVLNYIYSGKLKPSPLEVSTCVADGCVHDACGPSIHYAMQLMYASSTFQMKELVMLVQRRLLNFVDKALPEDVIPILVTASHCQLNHLLLHCIQRVARSDLDDISLEKELPYEVLGDIRSLRKKSTEENEACTTVVDSLNEKRIRSLLKALDSDDIELVTMLLSECTISLDDAYALHYASAYCDPKVVRELLNLGNLDLNHRNSRGYTVLHVAARRKDPSIVLELLKKGARVSDTTLDGQTAITICRRLTRPKDYNKKTNQGEESHKDRLCIDVLERQMRRDPMAGNISISETVGAESDLLMRLMLYEDRVAHARLLFPAEAKLAMNLARAYSTSEFEGSLASQESSDHFKKVNLNENPEEKTQRLLKRLEALQKTVENGRHFFPNCSEVLDKILDDDMPDGFFLEKGTDQEKTLKKRRFKELKHDVMKAFDKDKAEKSWVGFSPPSPSSSGLSKGALRFVVRKHLSCSFASLASTQRAVLNWRSPMQYPKSFEDSVKKLPSQTAANPPPEKAAVDEKSAQERVKEMVQKQAALVRDRSRCCGTGGVSWDLDEAYDRCLEIMAIDMSKGLTKSSHPILDLGVTFVVKMCKPLKKLSSGLVYLFKDLIEGMRMDLRKKRYESFDELYLYSYRAAGTARIMLSQLIGTPKECKAPLESIYQSAASYSIALHLTDILIEIEEDARIGRIYLPQDEITRGGLSNEAVFTTKATLEWRGFVNRKNPNETVVGWVSRAATNLLVVPWKIAFTAIPVSVKSENCVSSSC